MSKEVFIINKKVMLKVQKKVTKYSSSFKPSDAKQLFDNIKNNNKK